MPGLERFCQFVWPVVEGYWLSCFYIEKLWKGSKDNLPGQVQWAGQELFQERRLQFFECLDLNIVTRALARQAKGLREEQLRPFLAKSYDPWLEAKF